MTPDPGSQIVQAALQELGAAGPSELLAFLTPAVLADETRDPARTWSSGTVRYQFRRDGLAFNREQLAAAVMAAAEAEVTACLEQWVLNAESRLRSEPVNRAEAQLRDSLRAVGPCLSETSPAARALILLGAIDTGHSRRGAIETLRRVGGQLVETYADVRGVARPQRALAAEIGFAVVIGMLAAHWLSPGAAETRAVEHGVRHIDLELEVVRDQAQGEAIYAATESADEVVLRVSERLETVDLASAPALAMLEELSAVLPTSWSAFSRGREVLERVLATPGIRDAEGGERAWAIAAEVLSMAAGDRRLAEEAAQASTHRSFARQSRPDLMSSIRTGWLLLRLERFDQARAELERVRDAAIGSRMADVGSVAEAFLGYAAALDGPLDYAVEAARRVAAHPPEGADTEFARPLAAASAARAQLLAGDVEGAVGWSQGLAARDTPRSLGATMLEISVSWSLLASSRHTEALERLVTVRQRLERLHVTNPAGWAWLEPTVIALVRLDRVPEARSLIDRASGPAERWGTPIVVAEIFRARAAAASSPSDRRRELARALRTLEGASGRIERDRTWLMLTGGAGDAPIDSKIRSDSVLVGGDRASSGGIAGMTPRVRAVAGLVGDGLRNQEIADALHLAPTTVRQHVSTAMRATGTRSRTELALMINSSRAGSAPAGTAQAFLAKADKSP